MTASNEERIAAVREEIDRIDEQIIALMAQRQAQVMESGRIMADGGKGSRSAADRVEEVISHVTRHAINHGLSARVAELTYRVMVAEFAEIELRVYNGKDPY